MHPVTNQPPADLQRAVLNAWNECCRLHIKLVPGRNGAFAAKEVSRDAIKCMCAALGRCVHIKWLFNLMFLQSV